MRIRSPLLCALVAQFAAAVLVVVLYFALGRLFRVQVSLIQLGITQGIIAAGLGTWWHLSRWWFAINLGFVPLAIVLSAFPIPPWCFLVGFLVLLLLNWNCLGERVPFYLTGRESTRQLEEVLAALPSAFEFIDLGSGLAGVLVHLSRKYPAAHFEGVETAPLAFAVSWLRCLPRSNCRIRYRSFWKVPLAKYDVVYCFLSPVPIPRLWKKAKVEMKSDALFVSNTFPIPGVHPDRVIALQDWRDSKLFIWHIRQRKMG
ncbi:MAG: hypothetical protein ACYC3X_01545 [Pirellulaceae bacterium]